jgi:hypothetical protein
MVEINGTGFLLSEPSLWAVFVKKLKLNALWILTCSAMLNGGWLMAKRVPFLLIPFVIMVVGGIGGNFLFQRRSLER